VSKKITYTILIVLVASVLCLQIAQIIRTDKAENVPDYATYYLYRSPDDWRYYAVNSKTGLVELESSDPVWLIETTLERVPTNSRVVFGGWGGWDLERTLTIDGKWNGDPASDDRGFQEVVIDASQIEFVMVGDKARDFIIIDTVVGCEIYFGVIAADPDDGFSALKIRPTLPSQYTGNIGAHWSRVKAQIVQGSDSGVGVMLDGSSAQHGIQYMDVEVGSVGGYKTNVLINPGDNFAFGNAIKTLRNIAIPGGVGIQDGLRPTSRLYNNHYVSGVSSAGGVGLSIYGNHSQYDLNVTEADAGKVVVFQPGAWYNVVTGNSKLSLIGYTDNSGNDANRVLGWQP